MKLTTVIHCSHCTAKALVQFDLTQHIEDSLPEPWVAALEAENKEEEKVFFDSEGKPLHGKEGIEAAHKLTVHYYCSDRCHNKFTKKHST